MNNSPNARTGLLPEHRALQHERAPRPLPLFLELVRDVSAKDAELARAALIGLRAYEMAPRRERPSPPKAVAQVGAAALRHHGGSGPPAVLVPSLINPPHILDLDEEVSLTRAIASMGRSVLLLDWGPAREREDLSLAGHIEELLLPLVEQIEGPPALIGYCLGGTMAIAAANCVAVERVITLAAPWRMAAYPADSQAAVQSMWRHSEAAARELGALPMEVLQAAFWSLDPERTVRKFAEFGRLEPGSPDARRFLELEDWANGGEPLPYPAAAELIEELFGRDLPGSGTWQVGGRAASDDLPCPMIHLTARNDRIAPAATHARGRSVELDAGHVGMIVGSARHELHTALARALTPCR